MPEWTVTVNGTVHKVPARCTVAHLLEILEIDARRVAVERNRVIVPRATFATTVLGDGDHLEVVTFVGGGA
jgi:thiamine biosynthesis protein ThiS